MKTTTRNQLMIVLNLQNKISRFVFIQDILWRICFTPAQQIEFILLCSNTFHFLFQRYLFYITKGVRKECLAKCDPGIVKRILANKIPARLKSDPELEILINELLTEVEDDYSFSIRKAIGNTCYFGMLSKTPVRFAIILWCW